VPLHLFIVDTIVIVLAILLLNVFITWEEGRFGYGLGSCYEIDSDDIDVRYLVNVIQEVTRVRGSNLFWLVNNEV
jgi:hypothetical protein